jgi:hypothetical protein
MTEIRDWFDEKSNSEMKMTAGGGSGGSSGGSSSSDPYAQAGLPSPLEQYGVNNVPDPISTQATSDVSRTQDSLARAQAALASYTPPPEAATANPKRDNGGWSVEDVMDTLRGVGNLKNDFLYRDGPPQITGQVAPTIQEGQSKFGGQFGPMGMKPKGGPAEPKDLGQLYPDSQDFKLIQRLMEKSKISGADKGSEIDIDRFRQGLVDLGYSPEDLSKFAKAADIPDTKRQPTVQNRLEGDVAMNSYYANRASGRAKGEALGQSMRLQQQGRTPLTDALQQRLAMYRSIGLV